MIGRILNAVLQETKQFMQESAGQVLLKTNFKVSKLPDYTMPLVILGLNDAPDSFQYPGGLTQMGWTFSFNSYNYEPDGYVDDPTPYSTSLLYDPIDTIRRHFSLGLLGNGLVFPADQLTVGKIYIVTGGSITYNSVVLLSGTYFTCISGFTSFTTTNGGYVIGTSWLTQGMADMFNQYGLQFNLTGVTIADQVDQDGLVIGYKIGFETTSFDDGTLFIEDDIDLETITEIVPPNSIS
jgi:hypothetical protein